MEINENTACSCGLCPAIRAVRGLPPFCQMPRNVQRECEWYGTYTAAADAARLVGGKVRCITRSGGPRRFAVIS